MKRATRQSGMTLIEIMVVVAIIGLLAAVIGVYVVGAQKRAEREATIIQIRQLESALTLFRSECGRYPNDAEGLGALVKRPANCARWQNYLRVPEVPRDPWNQEYEYYEPGEHGQDVEVASRGGDGSLGTTDDLVSWTMSGFVGEAG